MPSSSFLNDVNSKKQSADNKLQTLLMQSGKLRSQLGGLSAYEVLRKSPRVLLLQSEELARKLSAKQYDADLAAVKADTQFRHLELLIENARSNSITAKRITESENTQSALDNMKSKAEDLIKKEQAEIEKQKALERQMADLVNTKKIPFMAKAVADLNDARLKGRSFEKFAFFNCLREASKQAQGDLRLEQMLDCWTALSGLFEEDIPMKDEVLFDASSSILNKNAIKPASRDLKFIANSKRVLSHLYVGFIEKTLKQNPKDVLLPPNPTLQDKIKAFCAVQCKRLSFNDAQLIEVVNGEAIWMSLFCLIRVGSFKEALALITMNAVYQRSDAVVSAYIKAMLTDPQSVIGSPDLQAEYNHRSMQGNQDPFKMALVKIAGKCDLHRKSVSPCVVQSVEDYLWLQLWLVTGDSGRYPFSDLQTAIKQLGPDHFSSASLGRPGNPLNYFFALLLTRQFKEAIESLLDKTAYHLEAVHVCIGCLYHDVGFEYPLDDLVRKLLPLLGTVVGSIGQVDYVACLTLRPRPDITDQILSDLLIGEHVDIQGLFGSEGTESAGRLRTMSPLFYPNGDADLKLTRMIKLAGEKCVQYERVYDALLLFNQCQLHKEVFACLNKELSRCFTKPILVDGQFDQLMTMAQSIVNYYAGKDDVEGKHACLFLQRAVHVKNLVWKGEYERALSTIDLMDVFPVDQAQVPVKLDHVLTVCGCEERSILPDLFKLAMKAIYTCYLMNREPLMFVDGGRQANIDILRTRGKALLLLSTLMNRDHPDVIPDAVCGEMAQTEVLMV